MTRILIRLDQAREANDPHPRLALQRRSHGDGLHDEMLRARCRRHIERHEPDAGRMKSARHINCFLGGPTHTVQGYKAFLSIIALAKARHPVKMFAFSSMSNHFRTGWPIPVQ